jgi:ADP-heptose:LPS heptosyltransferase
MSTRSARLKDAAYQALKRSQWWVLAPRYEELRLRQGWLRGDPTAPYEERVFPVAPDPESIRSVLVFKPDEIGDAVYGLPAVAELRRHLPHARFSCVCRPLTAPLLERSGLFDHIARFEPGSKLKPQVRSLRRALGELPEETFDLSIYLRTNPTTFRRFMSIPSRAKLHPLGPRFRSRSRLQAPVSQWGEVRRHQALQLLEIVSVLTGREYGFDDVRFPELHWTEEDREAPQIVFPSGEPPAFVVVHPFAKEETRRYPVEYWPPLLEALHGGLGVPLVTVGGPEDAPVDGPPSLVRAEGRLTIGQTAYLLSRASGFVGNLSGPAHLAAALGTPTVTLMSGNSLPVEWAPLGDSLVLRADVPCSPCHRSVCPGYGLACLRELTPTRVARPAIEFLGERLGDGERVSLPSAAAPGTARRP